MSKAVLISIQPKWCAKIANGKKTLEVRKNRPRLQTPFKCYIYCSMPQTTDPHQVLEIHGVDGKIRKANGKVIGEFVCNEIEEYRADEMPFGEYDIDDDASRKICLTGEELWSYGQGATLCGWHISNLVIYDKPKELGEFCHTEETACRRTRGKTWFKASDMDASLKKPPQSWCYVEEG